MSIRDILLAVAVVALWGMHFVVIRIGALEIPPFMLLSLRFFLCALLFLPFARRLTREEFKNLALYAVPFQGLHMGLLFIGLAQVDAGLGSLIMRVGIPFSIFLGWFFYQERFGLKTAIGLITILAGSAFMLFELDPNTHVTWLGVIFLIASSFFWALGSIRLKYIKDLNFPTMTGYAFLIPLPAAILVSFMFESGHIEALYNADHLKLGLILVYQVVLMSLSHYWWKVLIGRNPVYMVAPFSVLNPVFAVLFGIILLNEQLSLTTLAGGVVALLGVAIVTFRKPKRVIERTEGV